MTIADHRPLAAPGDETGVLSAPKRRGLGWQRGFLVLVAGVCLAGVIGYWLWCSEPAYWKHRQQFLDAHTTQELMAMGESLERHMLAQYNNVPARDSRLLSQIESARLTDPQQVLSLPVNHINAWLDQRLDVWLANQQIKRPPQIQRPMIAVVGDRLVIAFEANLPGIAQVVSVLLEPVVSDDESSRLNLMGLRGGMLPIPISTLRRHLEPFMGKDQLNDSLNRLADLFNPCGVDTGAGLPGAVKDSGHRDAYVSGIILRPDRIDLVFNAPAVK